MKFKRLLSSFLCAVMLVGTLTVPAFATELKSFKDVAADRWSHDAIMEMVDLGMFSGTTTPDANGVGTFNPTGTMTRAQYIVVVTRYLFNDELNAMEQGAYWYSNNYDLAVKHGLITKSEFSIDTLNNPITRQEMALVAVRTAQAQGETMPTLVSTDRIADYATIGNYYKDFVVKAFSMGLISGYDDKGTFGPKDTLTREQGAMVAYRLVNEDSRVYPSTKPTLPEIILPEINNGPMTIYEGQSSSRPAKAGDTYVKADGTKVVLKVGTHGVLGEGQGVAPDENLKMAGTAWTGPRFNYDAGTTGRIVDSLGNDVQNQKYIVNYTTGEGHWNSEWNAIKADYPMPSTPGTTPGQVSTDPYCLYVWTGISWAFNS